MNADDIRADYRAMIEDRGEPIFIRRYTGSGASRPSFDTEVSAVVSGYEPRELSGTIIQGDRRLIVLAQDLTDRHFPLPVTNLDKAVVRGKELAIIAADDSTRRVGTTLIAVEMQARG